MSSNGFHIQIKINQKTGFVEGGSKWNCGTWMDKMGSYSDGTHSNKGLPATPRDGSAIELVAMQFSILQWLSKLHEDGIYQYKGVTVNDEYWTYQEWWRRIQTVFESEYFNERESKSYYNDTVHASNESCNHQLRPNYMMAMAIAPDLFNREHAIIALQTGICELYGGSIQLGVKTLAPSDPHYRCYYDNSMGYCGDLDVCGGFSYHNGPEWLWPTGFILEAIDHFIPEWLIPNDKEEISETSQFVLRFKIGLVYQQLHYLMNDDWMSLPEMTNHDGEFNGYSCRAQAWSIGCLLWILSKQMIH